MLRPFLPALLPAFAALALLAAPSAAEIPKPETFDEKGFEPIFDGKTLKGWHVSAKTGHSGVSKNKSGGKWEVVDGAITGSQDVPGNGGIVITDKQYGDFEIALEMKNDDGPDSGLFLRCTEEGKCLQAMIDYHKGGNLMGVYGEGLGGKPHVRNFDFGKDVTEIVVPSKQPDGGFKSPVTAEEWPKFWKHERVERTAGPHRGQPAEDHDVDQGRQVHGVHRHREAAARRRRRHRLAGPRRRGLHEAVRAVPQRPREGTEEVMRRPPAAPTPPPESPSP